MVAAVIATEESIDRVLRSGFAEDLFSYVIMPEDAPVDRGIKAYTTKQPMPRQLGMAENMRTLRHWWGTLRNYYRLCDINGYFLKKLFYYLMMVNLRSQHAQLFRLS